MKTASEVALFRDDLDSEFLMAAFTAQRAAVDIETTGLDWKSDRIGTVQVHVPDFGTAIVQGPSESPTALMELMTSLRVQKVLHHAPFDLRFMGFRWRMRSNNIADTKVASRILYPSADHSDHSLAPLLRRHFDVKLDKSVRLTDWTSENLTADQLQYAAQDVEYLLPLLDVLLDEAVAQGVADLIEASYAYLPFRIATDLRECGDVFAY